MARHHLKRAGLSRMKDLAPAEATRLTVARGDACFHGNVLAVQALTAKRDDTLGQLALWTVGLRYSQGHFLSTQRRQSGILMNIHPERSWETEVW
jgi:hypothetical protein